MDAPVRVAPSARRASPAPTAGIVAATAMGANLLFVEDDPLIRRSLASKLRGAGHRVREAGTVAEALKLIPTEAYDAALVDYRLPDGTGFDVLSELVQRHSGI